MEIIVNPLKREERGGDARKCINIQINEKICKCRYNRERCQ